MDSLAAHGQTQKRRSRAPEQQRWYEECKSELLRTEPRNIAARAAASALLINESISTINALLQLPALSESQRFVSSVRGKEAFHEHLSFLLNWPGLRTDASAKRAQTKKSYEKKSKNWLNGRRAPNYAKTLFPRFVRDAEAYARAVSVQLIDGHGEAAALQRKLYEDCVVYGVLDRLCGCTLSLHEQAKKAPFFCKNSLERKGPLRTLLQSYAADHEYVHAFPSCAEAAVGYFHKKYTALCREYQKRYLDLEDGQSYSVETRTPSEEVTDSHSHSGSAAYWRTQYLQLERKMAEMRSERDYFKNIAQQPRTNYSNSASFGYGAEQQRLTQRQRQTQPVQCAQCVNMPTKVFSEVFSEPRRVTAPPKPPYPTRPNANRYSLSLAIPAAPDLSVQQQPRIFDDVPAFSYVGDTSNETVLGSLPPTPDAFRQQFSNDIFQFPVNSMNLNANMSMRGADTFSIASPPAFMCLDSEAIRRNNFRLN